MKNFKAIYSKEYECEIKQAIQIAKLYQPKDTKLENVIQIDRSVSEIFEDNDKKVNDLFEDLAQMFNPNK